ncbi:CBS domain-containing protein [Pseudodesulfovibrio sp. JC047]|uniref:CBS domain-containing protein n=1 Tax=Pseudodesulfovibrio sp. JC047 TaxID=2683199 RepID=UPI0013D59206|nr:CBS domain-containing protein [Pseudodesulfovibrio sp. JC047]NDV20511.1 CBS domain-containing protein [Pseudodesulfovibrio sp. JC047]
MLTAQDIMTTDCITLTPDTDITTAAQTLLTHKINGAPVLEEETVVGILCQADLVVQQKKITMPSFFTLLDGVFPISSHEDLEREMSKMSAVTVAEAMTHDPTVISPETSLEDIATVMANQKLFTLPVVENEALVGVVGKEDVLKTLLKA